jgi:hypothetical protein
MCNQDREKKGIPQPEPECHAKAQSRQAGVKWKDGDTHITPRSSQQVKESFFAILASLPARLLEFS